MRGSFSDDYTRIIGCLRRYLVSNHFELWQLLVATTEELDKETMHQTKRAVADAFASFSASKRVNPTLTDDDRETAAASAIATAWRAQRRPSDMSIGNINSLVEVQTKVLMQALRDLKKEPYFTQRDNSVRSDKTSATRRGSVYATSRRSRRGSE